MQVQHRPLLIGTWILGASLLTASACDHQGRKSESPDAAESEELATLRRDNANLRARIQNLEEQVRILEQEERWTAEERGYESISLGSQADYAMEVESQGGGYEPGSGPRELPVVKLTPKGRSIERRPAADEPAPKTAKRGSSSIALSPVPHSGAPGYGEDYGDYADGDDQDYWDARESAPAAPMAAQEGTQASYRLVGSKLVQATKSKPSRPAGQPSDRASGVVRDYEAAMDIYREGRYADAEQAFEAIVSAHPNHDYADNALYWQGEAAYDQAHYADALAAFTAVVERYGGGNKAPDALLKIGLCYGRLGDDANARDVLTQLIAAYPRAEASKIAKRKLADIED